MLRRIDPDLREQIGPARPAALRRVLGPVSILCVGVGAAVGSGVFATPGDVAALVSSPWLILLAWLLAGVITFLQTLVTAELATRFPRAGGEYQYLRAAYGDFAAFFFGWSFTIFIVGGGAGTVAAAFGRFAAELFGQRSGAAESAWGCAAILIVTLLNTLGIRTGAATQNLLTVVKVAALLAIAAAVPTLTGRWTPRSDAGPPGGAALPSLDHFLLALMIVFWSYTGATDSAKLAEETKDAGRSVPFGLWGSALVLIAVYFAYNYALLCGASPLELRGKGSAAAMLFETAGVRWAGSLVLMASGLICLGSISSMLLANTRVTYALARDGLTFAALGRMSAGQAPVPALIVGALIAGAFVVQRDFSHILRIYFLASTVLFGLSYWSLIVFRRRDRRAGGGFPAGVYRVPAGGLVAGILVAVEAVIALSIVRADLREGTRDSLWTLVLLAALAGLYAIWPKGRPPTPCPVP